MIWSLRLTGVLVFMVGEGVGFVTSFYWAVVTSSSIGYGDVVPTTSPMRWFTAFYRWVGGFTLTPNLPVCVCVLVLMLAGGACLVLLAKISWSFT